MRVRGTLLGVRGQRPRAEDGVPLLLVVEGQRDLRVGAHGPRVALQLHRRRGTSEAGLGGYG